MFIPSLGILLQHISEICKQDTSSDPEGWTPENPLWGHCAIIAVLIQELYGGDIWRASLTHIPKLAHVRSHYGNLLPVNVLLDATAAQYWPEYPKLLELTVSSRGHILANSATLTRFAALRERYATLALRISLHASQRTGSTPEKVGRPVPRKPKRT